MRSSRRWDAVNSTVDNGTTSANQTQRQGYRCADDSIWKRFDTCAAFADEAITAAVVQAGRREASHGQHVMRFEATIDNTKGDKRSHQQRG
jgi:hypothetical protein